MAKLMMKTAKNTGHIKANPLLHLAISMYLGETCQGCGRTFKTLASMVDSVWWPHEHGRIGHDRCYRRSALVAVSVFQKELLKD
jgi:hypothetical protein